MLTTQYIRESKQSLKISISLKNTFHFKQLLEVTMNHSSLKNLAKLDNETKTLCREFITEFEEMGKVKLLQGFCV